MDIGRKLCGTRLKSSVFNRETTWPNPAELTVPLELAESINSSTPPTTATRFLYLFSSVVGSVVLDTGKPHQGHPDALYDLT